MIATRSTQSPQSIRDAASEVVEVRYGTHRLEGHFAGLTAAEVKAGLRDRWGVAYFAVAVVNGRLSEVAIQLHPGDRLEFRRFGFKGSEENPYAEADLVIANSPELQRIVAEENGVEAVRKTVRFCLTWCGRPGQGDMARVYSLLERIASSVDVTASSINRVADRLDQPASTPTESPYLLAPEAAVYLRSTLQTIYDWVKHGKLHPEPGFEGRLVFTRESLDRFARTRRRRR